ncbi:thiolase family protein [Thiothrix eikelboomii]|uniref:Acetyl-CoA acyltransferase n=1 Tax=Thiothrix eikelboomii TaxID=92487 RepID=A0A1T4WQB9_9GAMM|nr:thiolase family protein [Thiothrix eikelboomii]SKA79543.1 acetyl-CoA acyltransferase [Thiothrix eikelboomii]
MKQVVIAGYARTPFTLANKGELARVRPDDLAATAVKGLMTKTGIDAKEIEDLMMGCAFPEGEQGFNIARLVVLMAGLPISIGGVTVNRFCGSSMQSIHQAAGAIQMNAGHAFICAGVESMTRVPMAGFNPSPNPKLYETMPNAYISMGLTAENLAKQYGISRQEQEAFAVASHQKAAAAQQAGRLADEIVAVGAVTQDGCIRPETTLETLAGLKLAFDERGSVTAGTSSPLTDGASATLVCSEEFAKAHGLPILARIKSIAISGCAPEIMGIGPVLSSQKALQRAGLTVNDLDIIELNEAFSSQSLACIRDLGLDLAKINLDGGAIALGHPLGATGARITGKAAALLNREGKQFALATQCIGGGQGIATILEAV